MGFVTYTQYYTQWHTDSQRHKQTKKSNLNNKKKKKIQEELRNLFVNTPKKICWANQKLWHVDSFNVN